jgi:RimJ/RimL family protein N-acetyltransferase
LNHAYNGAFRSIELEPLTRENIEYLRVLRNRNKKWFLDSVDIASEEQEIWFSKYVNNKKDFMFQSIYDGYIIGFVGICNVDLLNKKAELGRLIVDCDKTKKHGIGREIVKCACNIAYTQIELNELYLVVYDNNIAALITYLKSGFIIKSIKNNIVSMSIDDLELVSGIGKD